MTTSRIPIAVLGRARRSRLARIAETCNLLKGNRSRGRFLPPRQRRPEAAVALVRFWLAMLVIGGLGIVPPVDAAPQRTLLVLGDSISAAYGIQREEGWVVKLEARLAELDPTWRVVNASASGETTGGGLTRLPAAMAAHAPALVVIELGGNDGLRGYPLARIRDNLDAMVQVARDAGSSVLLVGMEIPPNYGPRYTQGFAALFREVAQTHGVPLVPFLLEDVALNPGMMQADGIHPTAAAQPLMLETVWPHLEPLLTR